MSASNTRFFRGKLDYQTLAALALGTIMALGCGPSDLADLEIPVNQAAVNRSQPDKTNSINATSNVADESPAADQNKLPQLNAEPTEICAKFIRFLNDDNQKNVELLLTPAALTVTSRAKFHIPPLGEPNAKFTLSEPRYGTNKQKLCYVDCKLSEIVDGNAIETEITWMLRRQKMGWRIGGMMLTDQSNGSLDLLSFENMNDVIRIKNDLREEVSIQDRDAAIIGLSTSKKP